MSNLCNLRSFYQFTLFNESNLIDVRSCATAGCQHSIKLDSTYVNRVLKFHIYDTIVISDKSTIRNESVAFIHIHIQTSKLVAIGNNVESDTQNFDGFRESHCQVIISAGIPRITGAVSIIQAFQPTGFA